MGNPEDDSTANKLINALGDNVPKLVPATVKKIDMALANGVEGIYFLLGGDRLETFNQRRRLTAQKNARRLINEIERIDENDLSQAPMEIETPLLEQLSSTQDEALSQILIQLLVAACSKTQGHLVHPTMISVAKNLAPDEAAILSSFRSETSQVPMIRVRQTDQRSSMKGATIFFDEYFSKLGEIDSLKNPENIDFYAGNLISLGLFEALEGFLPIRENEENKPNPVYKYLEEKAERVFKKPPEHFKFTFTNLIYKPTKKGEMFIRIINNVKIEKS